MSEWLRDAFIEMRMKHLKQQLVITSRKSFLQLRTSDLGAVQNCRKADYDRVSLKLKLLEVDGKHQECLGIDFKTVP